MNLVTVENIGNHLEKLSHIGRLSENPEDGFLRASWSNEESAAFDYIGNYAEDIGLSADYDNVGNLFIRTGNGFENIVQVGSHLDTVPEGGNYDGAAGIIAGIEAINSIRDERLAKDLELVLWRGEESATYDVVYKGSKAAFGIASSEMLTKKFNGQTLEEAIRGQGFDPDYIRKGMPTISQEHIDSIFSHFELHIEQARKLEQDNIDIGNITSIRGPSRYLVTIEGEFDHSGATPMDEYRRDANLAMSYINVRLDELRKNYDSDLVQTVGEINSNKQLNDKYKQVLNNSLTKVSGFGYFTMDIRSNDNSFKDEYCKKVFEVIKDTANEFNVKSEIIEIGKSDAIESLSGKVQSAIDDACSYHGYSVIRMPSGAGHDSAIVAKQMKSNGSYIPAGMIFIPCRNGKSHCKQEYTSSQAITKGANVMAYAMYSLANNEF